MVFGERTRTSENPYRIEEGTYINGRLSMYVKDRYVYKLEWSSSGQILRITKYYQTTGEEIKCFVTHGFWTEQGKRIDCPGTGLVISDHIYVPRGILQTDQYYGKEAKRIEGYQITSEWLHKIVKAKSLCKISGQLAKKWVDRSSDEKLIRIMNNGRFDSDEVFTADKVSCEAFLN